MHVKPFLGCLYFTRGVLMKTYVFQAFLGFVLYLTRGILMKTYVFHAFLGCLRVFY